MALVDRPIQLYLDSSDFSNLANRSSRTDEISAVERFLVEMKDQGLIELRFSEAHIMEASPSGPSAISAGLDRLCTIQRLCGRKCLSHPTDLTQKELDKVYSSKLSPTPEHDVYRDDGYWFPSAFRLGTILPTREEILAEIVGDLPRGARRKFVRNGSFTRDAFISLASSLPDMQTLTEKLPLSADSIKVIESYYRGDRKLVEAERAVYDSIADLVEFGNLFLKNWAQANDLTRHFRHESENLHRKLKEQYADLASKVETQMGEGLSIDQIEHGMAAAFHLLVKNTGAKLAAKMVDGADEEKILAADPWACFPGITTASTLLLHVARRSAKAKQSRAPKVSDFGDAYHAVYLPYVDVFRADAFIASVLRECKLPFPTVVVDRFLDLPMRIQELIQTRSRVQI